MYRIPTPEARSCFEKARDLCEIQQFNEALNFLNEALNFYPLYLNVLNQKGVVLCKLGKPKEAIDCFNRAIEIKSNYIRAWNNKGQAFSKLGKYMEALDCFDFVLNIKPDLPTVHPVSASTKKIPFNSAVNDNTIVFHVAPPSCVSQIVDCGLLI